MADIQIVYREGFCSHWSGGDCFCMQCYTQCAEDMGCKFYSDGGEKTDANGNAIIQFGDCYYADWKHKFKGWSGKNYEMEEVHDPYNPHLDSMRVILGRTEYDCVKVTLDGKCIYNEYDKEDD